MPARRIFPRFALLVSLVSVGLPACAGVFADRWERMADYRASQKQRLEVKKHAAWSSGAPKDALEYSASVVDALESARKVWAGPVADGPPKDPVFELGPYFDDAIRCVAAAAEKHPEEASGLYLREAELDEALERKAPARAAYERSFAASPNMRAFRALVESAPTGAVPEDKLHAMCDAVHPKVRLVTRVDRAAFRRMPEHEAEDLLSEIVVFLDRCDGIRGIDGDRSLFRAWVTPEEARAYSLYRQAERDVAADEADREAMSSCADDCARRFEECVAARGPSPAARCDEERGRCGSRCSERRAKH